MEDQVKIIKWARHVVRTKDGKLMQNLSEHLTETEYLGDPDINGRIILSRIFKK
jgi:hypothetical protein